MSVLPRRAARFAAALVPALVAASISVLPAPARAADPVPAPVLTWKISQQFVNALPVHTLDGGATEASGVVTFPNGVGSYNPANGTSTMSYSGSVQGAFKNGSCTPGDGTAGDTTCYWVKFANPTVTVGDGGEGTISAEVTSAAFLTSGGVGPGSTATKRVVLTTFDADAGDWVAGSSYGSLTATPDWTGVITPDSAEATDAGIPAGQPFNGGAFAASLIKQLYPSVRSHFYWTTSASANKVAAAFTAEAPAMTVSKTITAVSPSGGLTVAVSGTGFRGVTNDGDAGIYVGIAEAGGLPDTNDQNAFAGSAYVPTASIVNGAFTKSVNVPTAKLDSTKSYAIYTWQAHTHSNTSQDTETALPINFAQLQNAPAVTKKITAVSPTGGLTVAITGSNFVGATNPGDAGVYVGIAEAGGLPDVTSQAGMAAFVGSAYLPTASIVNGAFTKTITVPTASLDSTKTYAIYTWQAHSHSSTSQDTVTALPINFGQLQNAPTVTKKITAINPTGGLTVAVTGSNFVGVTNPGDAGIYVGIAEAGGLPDVTSQAGMAAFVGSAYLPTASIVNGAFTKTISVPTASLDLAKTYAIYTWQAHSHSNTSQDTVTALPFNVGQLQTTPGVNVVTTSASPAGGVSIDVTGTNFYAQTNPGDAGVYVGVAEAGGLPDVSSQDGASAFVASDYVLPGQIVSGGFTRSLNLPTAKLDPSKTYAVYTWQAHSHSSTSQDTVTALPIDFAQLASAPAVTVSGPAAAKFGALPGTYKVTVPGATSGSVQVKRNGAVVGSAAVNASGVATFVAPRTWPVGTQTLTFAYGGNGGLLLASSKNATLTISKASVTETLRISVKPTRKKAGKAVVRVSSTVAGAPAPTGLVRIQLVKGGKVRTLAARTLANGTVTITLPKLAKGTWKVRATYLGSAGNLTTTVNGSVKVK